MERGNADVYPTWGILVWCETGLVASLEGIPHSQLAFIM